MGTFSTLTTSHPTAQISSQQPGHKSPAPPVNYAGGVGVHESQGPGPHVPPQAASQRSSSGAPHRRPSQQRGKSSGNINRIQSRQNTEVSEVSPVLPRHGAYNPNELQQSRVDQFDGLGSGTRESPSDLQKALSSRNRSRTNVGGQGSRESFVHGLVFTAPKTYLGNDPIRTDFDDNDQGRYWSERRRHNRGASRVYIIIIFPCSVADVDGGSNFNVGDGDNRGGPSQNPSRGYSHFVLLKKFVTFE